MHRNRRRRRYSRGQHHLSELKKGSLFKIRTINGNRESRIKLYEMGFYPGKTGSVLSINPNGVVVIVSDDFKIIITSALADKVIVQQCL